MKAKIKEEVIKHLRQVPEIAYVWIVTYFDTQTWPKIDRYELAEHRDGYGVKVKMRNVVVWIRVARERTFLFTEAAMIAKLQQEYNRLRDIYAARLRQANAMLHTLANTPTAESLNIHEVPATVKLLNKLILE